MKPKLPSIERIGIITGLLTSLALISYFMIMKALNLAQILELRMFNFIIIAVGVCYGIYKLKHELHAEGYYLKGIAQGIYISLIAVVTFALFMGIYLTYFDVALMEHIKSTINVASSINGFTIFFTIFMEGMASGAIITFAAMQYFKSQGSEQKIIQEK